MRRQARFFLFICLLLFLCPLSRAQSQGGSPDVTIQSCAVFTRDEHHLDAAFHVVTKGYQILFVIVAAVSAVSIADSAQSCGLFRNFLKRLLKVFILED